MLFDWLTVSYLITPMPTACMCLDTKELWTPLQVLSYAGSWPSSHLLLAIPATMVCAARETTCQYASIMHHTISASSQLQLLLAGNTLWGGVMRARSGDTISGCTRLALLTHNTAPQSHIRK